MRFLATLLLTCSLTSPCFAIQDPPPGKQDPHVRIVPYSPLNRTLLVGVVGRSTTITFSATERIERVTFGSPDAPWEGPDASKANTAPLRNNLPLWPVKPGRSNMQVTTQMPNGDERLYQFALVAHGASTGDEEDAQATYGLIFSYPAEVHAVSVAVFKQRKAVKEAAEAKARLSVDILSGPRNWRYFAKGRDKELSPSEVSDNGNVTAFRFEGNTQVPAIYVVDANGERIAPFDAKGELMVVPFTAAHFRLRLGNRVLDLFNAAYDPVGNKPDTGTSSPDVVREVRAQ